MKRINRRSVWLFVGAVVVSVGGAVWLLRQSGPTEAEFAYVREPRLARIADQRMLVVVAQGDPDIVAGKAFRRLFRKYYQLQGISRATRPPAPRARWRRIGDTPRTEWVGRYALPVPDSVPSEPSTDVGEGLRIAIETWRYGEVAEVLHVGPYSGEERDIKRLLAFVASRGYQVAGDHEEEYVRGPGMFLAGDPNRYLTIIRLNVRRADDL